MAELPSCTSPTPTRPAARQSLTRAPSAASSTIWRGLSGASDRLGLEGLREGEELELGEERMQRLPIRLVALQERHVEGDRRVGPEGHEILRHPRLVPMVDQPLPIGPALYLVDVLQNRLEVAELPDEVASPLLADPGDSRDVVDGVAHEGEHVHHPFWRNAELLLHPLRVVERRARPFAPGVQNRHSVAHELEQVLVSRDDDHPHSSLEGQAGQGCDDVVGLEARGLDDGHPERLADAPHVWKLNREVLVHLGPVGLVGGVGHVPKGRPWEVEADADEPRVLVLVELPQHRGEAVRGPGRQPPARGEAPDREVGPVHLRAAVDEVDDVGSGHYSRAPPVGPGVHAVRRLAGPSTSRLMDPGFYRG